MTGPTTISKVIAFELGVLIAVLTWIAFAGIPGMKPRPVTDAEEPADRSFANVSRIDQPTRSHRRAPFNYPADDLQAAQALAQYPVATVQTYDPGLTARGYDDTVDARGQLSYGYDQPSVEGYVVNQDPANYIGTFPEPVLDSPYDYYYGRPYGYTQPVEIIVLNNNRGFTHRNRIDHCSFAGGPRSAPQQNPRVRPRVQGGQAATRPDPIVMGPGVRPRPRVSPGNNNLAPRRTTAPVQKARPGQASQARRNP